jgi:hypothetical protein
MTRRAYSKRTKLSAVMAAEMTTVAEAARAADVPETTLRYWMDDPKLAEFRSKTREDLVDGTGLLAHRILERISATLDQFEPRDLTILFGVMVDKAQLLSGGATSRLESRDLTGTLSDDDVRDAIRSASDLLGAGAGGTAAEVADPPTG